MSHTPGPWYVEKPYEEPGIYIAAALNTSLVAKLYEPDANGLNVDKPITTLGNARLIAAAPDLFEALQKTTAWLDNLHAKGEFSSKINVVIENARAAIAKATGVQQ